MLQTRREREREREIDLTKREGGAGMFLGGKK